MQAVVVVVLFLAFVAVAVTALRAAAALVGAPLRVGTGALFAITWLALIGEARQHLAPTALDGSVLTWFVEHRAGPVTVLAEMVAALGSTAVVAVVAAAAVVLLWLRAQRRQAALVGVTALGAGALVVVTKQLVGRMRPPVVDHLVFETNQSFPSGHALGSTAVYGVLALVVVTHLTGQAQRMLTVVAAASLVVAIGLSRLYLGVHWATDVLSGWLIGGSWLAVCVCVVGFAAVTQRSRIPSPVG